MILLINFVYGSSSVNMEKMVSMIIYLLIYLLVGKLKKSDWKQTEISADDYRIFRNFIKFKKNCSEQRDRWKMQDNLSKIYFKLILEYTPKHSSLQSESHSISKQWLWCFWEALRERQEEIEWDITLSWRQKFGIIMSYMRNDYSDL